MTSVTEEELLAAVFAAPDDDAPRRVYADWLLERGDPRGEFIQLQCARGLSITTLDPVPSDETGKPTHFVSSRRLPSG